MLKPKTRVCSCCHKRKLISCFPVWAYKDNYIDTQCRTCLNIKKRAWEQKDPEKKRQQRKQSYYRHKKEISERRKRKRKLMTNKDRKLERSSRRKWEAEHPEEFLAARLRRMYNISLDYYNQMQKIQDYKCYICEHLFSEFSRRPYVDHDKVCCSGKKSCGKCVRGLLCRDCNLALGQFEKKGNPNIFDNIIKYLVSYTKRRQELCV